MPDDLQAGDPAGGAHHDVDQRQHLSDAWQQHLQQHHMPPVLQDAAAPPVTNPDRSKLRILSGSRWGPAEISSSQWTACGLRNPAEQLLLQQQNQQQQEDEAWQSMRRGMDLKPSNAAAAANAYGDARAEAILTTASGNVAAAALGWAAQDRAKSRTYIRPLASMQESTSKDSLKQASRAKDGKQGQQLSAKTAPGEGDARELERASERSAGRLDLQHEREGRDTLVGRREGPQSPAHEAPQNQQQQQGQEELQQEGWQEQQRLQYTHMAQQLRQLLLLQKQLQLGGGYQLDQAPIIADVNGSSGHRSGSTEVIAHAQQDRVEGSKGAQLSSGGAQRYGGKDSTPVIDATTRKLLSGVRVGAAFAVSKLHETQPSLKAPVERASAYPTAQVSVPGGTLRTALDVNGSLAAGTAVGPAAAKASDVASPGTAGPAADATGEPGFPSADSASPTGESTETHITTGPPATATGSAAAVASAAVASTTAPDRARPEPHLKQPGASSRRGAATASGEGGHVNDGIEGDEEQCYRAPDQGPGSGSGGAATAAVSTVAASGRGGGVEITMEDLRRTFLLPAPQAARVLRTSTTNLKRKCRQLGILRWPHRKLDSLHRLRTLVLNEVRDAGEQQALLDSISRNTEEILQDPNLGLAPALKNLRQAYYKRGFDVRARGLGRAPGTADSDDSM
ncbi:hypothetical protein Vretifemale_5171 [Volvox reticuliferus]|nr:hypothetical protein Vretifemale_5171 [Volvox reticuliferus]